ncbi:TonB-dependent receptor [Aureivirga sp. CE67]|uniref:TonB-dependent receptor n=1 Tax=Aureivirga sp. CE67 TaxID=1788983 RepID=UPI0018C8F0F5|nr:TonB-dependent receptor [Aureivirga sp. CE67]
MRTYLFVLLIFSSMLSFSQDCKHTFSGKVMDLHDSSILLGASVHIKEINKTVSTNPQGEFIFKNLCSGTYTVTVFHYECEPLTKQITINQEHISEVFKLEHHIEELEKVEINGNKRKVFQKKSALSTTVINKENLQQRKETSLAKSLEHVAGVSTISIGSGQAKPTIRGFGFNRVVVVQNGIKHEAQQWGADHGLEIDQNAVEHIEIYKGPLSLLVGSDAIGGVINIKEVSIPKKNSFGGNVSLIGRTNNDLVGLSTFLSGRKEHWFFKNTITANSYGDFKVPTDKILYNGYVFDLHNHQLRNTAGRVLNISGTIGYTKDDFLNRTIISNVNEENGFFANAHGLEVIKSQIDYDKSSRDIDLPKHKLNHFKITNETEIHKENYTLRINAGFQNNARQELSEPSEHGYMPKPTSSLEREFNKNTYSLNVFADLYTNSKHKLKFGVNSEFQDNSIGGWGYIIPAYHRFSAGAFVYDKIEISPKFYLHTGIRYDYGTLKTEQYQDWFLSPVNENGTIKEEYLIRATAKDFKFGDFSASFGGVYDLKNQMFKFNLGKSFRMPLANELTSDGVNYHMYRYELGNADLKAEESYQVDLEYSYTKPKFNVAVSPFVNYFPNYIYLNPTSDYYEALQIYKFQEAEVFRFGGEITSSFLLTEKLFLNTSVEYIYARQLSGAKKGFTLPFSPPLSGIIGANYTLKNYKYFKNTKFELDWRFTAKQNEIVPPESPTDGYTVGNFTMSTSLYKKDKKWADVYFRVNNILDTKYFNHTSFYRIIEVPEPGRNFSLEVRIPF